MLTARFDEALAFASRLHRTQTRKGTEVPYISHLLAVTALVIEDGGDEDQAIAALLHDPIEDQGDNYSGGRDALRQRIGRVFGDTVLNIVKACTDDEGFSKSGSDAKLTWRARKQKYLDHLWVLDLPARRVSCADKLHNGRCVLADYRSLGENLWTRFRTGNREDQLWYYDNLAGVFLATNTGPLAEELNRVVDDIFAHTGAHRTDG